MNPTKVAIVLKPSGRGVLNDAEILKSKISQDYDVEIIRLPIKKYPDYFCYGLLKKTLPALYQLHLFFKHLLNKLKQPSFDLAIYIETSRPQYMFLGRKNVLIPNQEWFSKDLTCMVPYFDEIWCKTYYSQSIFKEMSDKCRYIGFSSQIMRPYRSEKKR